MIALLAAVLLFIVGFWTFAWVAALIAVVFIARLILNAVRHVGDTAKKAAKTINEVNNPVVVDDGYVCTACGATFQLETHVCPHCGGSVVREK